MEFDGLNVATGPVFKDNLGTIGVDVVTVPEYYYKVIYSEKNQIMVGLILKHQSSYLPLEQFVVPVDSIEELTGIDFFPGLDDKMENRLEGIINTASWDF